MATAVGSEGLTAIRDFIKPYTIGTADILNSGSIWSSYWADDFSTTLFGHGSLSYSWSFSSTKLAEAKCWNFWNVTECAEHDSFILCKNGENIYQGIRKVGNEEGYLYTVTVFNTYCDVNIKGICFPQNSISLGSGSLRTGDFCIGLDTLFMNDQAKMGQLFALFQSGNSFIFPTPLNISPSFTKNNDTWYIVIPLNTQGTAIGTVRMNFVGSIISYSGDPLMPMTWKGDSYFNNQHQIWQITYDSQNDFIFVLVNTQDLAIQVLSAAEYANLSTKDDNVLYFVPEE